MQNPPLVLLLPFSYFRFKFLPPLLDYIIDDLMSVVNIGCITITFSKKTKNTGTKNMFTMCFLFVFVLSTVMFNNCHILELSILTILPVTSSWNIMTF